MKALKTLVCVVLITALTISLAVSTFAGAESDPWGLNCIGSIKVVERK